MGAPCVTHTHHGERVRRSGALDIVELRLEAAKVASVGLEAPSCRQKATGPNGGKLLIRCSRREIGLRRKPGGTGRFCLWPIDDQPADNPVAAAEAATTRSRGGSKPAGLGRFRQIKVREKYGLFYANQVLFQLLNR